MTVISKIKPEVPVSSDPARAHTLPARTYCEPDIYEREKDAIFYRSWWLAGHKSRLSEPGSYLTMNDFGIPILATRDKSGEFHAFLNACRHRSVQVASESRGQKSVFMCPFHSWSYANTGDLINIPDEDHFGAIDKSCHGLIELPAVERDGLLWVHPSVDGKLDVDELLGEELAAEFASYDITRHQFVGEKTIEMEYKRIIGKSNALFGALKKPNCTRERDESRL